MKIALRMFIVLLLATSTTIGAEYFAGPEYNHKLWRISGNGLKKDSYIFVMYNTSNKKAFMLEDSIYAAFKKSDLVLQETHYYDNHRCIIPETKLYDNFDFEKYFSPEKLKEIKDSVEARGGYFEKAINSRSSFQLIRNLRSSNQYLDTNNSYKTDLSSILTNLTFLENKIFEGIFDINDKIKYCLNLSDEIKVSEILNLLKENNDLDKKLYTTLYVSNQLDSIYNLKMKNDFEVYEKDVFERNKDSIFKFVNKNLEQHSIFSIISLRFAIGNDGLIDKLRNSGFIVEPVHSETKTDLISVLDSYEKMDWTNLKIEKLGIEISLPKLYVNASEITDFGNNYFDVLTNMSYFIQVYDVPDFSSTNPLQYFHEANLKMRANYSENINLKQIFTPDSLLKFEFEAKRNKYYQKYHLVYFDKRIYKINVISDTLNMNLQHADKFLSSYKFNKPAENKKYLYKSPSKDFQIEFQNKPSEKLELNEKFKGETILTLIDKVDTKFSVFKLISIQFPKTKFINDDSITYDFVNNFYEKKNNKYEIILKNQSTFEGFTSLDFIVNYENTSTYYRIVVGHNRVYRLVVQYPKNLEDKSIFDFYNSFKITLNHDTSMKTFETETARFKLPKNMVRDSLIDDDRNKDNILWGDSEYFIRQDYTDTILGTTFDFKIKEFPKLYFASVKNFKEKTIRYLNNITGSYDIIYCKPYSDRIKNSYIFEVKSKKSKAVLKGIFYPFKNNIYSFSVISHQVFHDSSYINKVFDSFEFTFEPEEEQELFRNKLLELMKLECNKDDKKDPVDFGVDFSNALINTNNPKYIKEALVYLILNEKSEYYLLNYLLKKFKEINTNNEFIEEIKNLLDKNGFAKIDYNFILLKSLSSINSNDNCNFIIEQIISNSKFYNNDLNYNLVWWYNYYIQQYSIHYFIESIFNDIINNQPIDEILLNPNYTEILNIPLLQQPISHFLSPDILNKIRNSDKIVINEEILLKSFNRFIDKDLIDEIDSRKSFNKFAEMLVYLCKSPESLEFIKDSVLNNKLISIIPLLSYQNLYPKSNIQQNLLDYFNSNSNLFEGYSILKSKNQLNLFPSKYLNYESIAESQLIDFFCRRENGLKDFKIDFIIKSDDSASDDKKYYNIYQVSFKADVFDDETKKFVKDKYIEMSILAGPYSEKINIEKLDIPDKKITIIKGFCKKSDFEKLIMVHTGELIDNTNEIYTVEDMDDTLLFD